MTRLLTPEREHEIRAFDVHELIRFGDADYKASATVSRMTLDLLREIERLRGQNAELESVPSWTLDALRAVREALDIPDPATVGDGAVWQKVMDARVMHTVIVLRVLLGSEPDDPQSTVDYLREQLAKHPPTGYTAWGQPAAARPGSSAEA